MVKLAEIVYLLVPTALILGLAAWQHKRTASSWRWVVPSAIAGGVVIGALPWIWANAQSHLASLTVGSFAVPPGAPGYVGRLKTVPRYVFPMLLSLRQQFTASWLGGRIIGIGLLGLLGAAIVAALAVCLLRGGRSAAFGIALIAFPFLMAYSPATWFWEDGRYATYAVPLIVLVLVAGCHNVITIQRLRRTGSPSRRITGTGLGFVVGGLLAVTSIWNFFAFVAPNPTVRWAFPDNPSLSSVRQLEASGASYGYAAYWVAYRLDFLSSNQLRVTVAGNDTLGGRPSIERCTASDHPAWLFVAPTSLAVTQFGAAADIQGPNGMPETTFLSYLQHARITFRVVHAGMIEAVIPGREGSPQIASPTLRW